MSYDIASVGTDFAEGNCTDFDPTNFNSSLTYYAPLHSQTLAPREGHDTHLAEFCVTPSTDIWASVRAEERLVRWNKDKIVAFALIHLVAALAFLPWFFSWTGVTLLGTGLFVFGTLGINLCHHRLLTHRGFSCPLWLEHTLALLGVCSLQESPPHWVAVHRRHHQFADEDKDPHSPNAGFFWAHMGWLLVKMDDMSRAPLIERYAKDIIRDPFYAWFERRKNWMKIAFGVWVIYFAAGFVVVAFSGKSLYDAMQFGLSLLVWGGALRTVVEWHITWSVNSVTHVWGYRNYATPDVSRNNAWIGLIAAGEGWHNNHHADSRSACHGHEWWEFDVTWMVIRLLMLLGLAWNVATPSPALKEKFNSRARSLVPAGEVNCQVQVPRPHARFKSRLFSLDRN